MNKKISIITDIINKDNNYQGEYVVLKQNFINEFEEKYKELVSQCYDVKGKLEIIYKMKIRKFFNFDDYIFEFGFIESSIECCVRNYNNTKLYLIGKKPTLKIYNKLLFPIYE